MSIEGEFNVTLYKYSLQKSQNACTGVIDMSWNSTSKKGSVKVASEACELSILSTLRFYDPVINACEIVE